MLHLGMLLFSLDDFFFALFKFLCDSSVMTFFIGFGLPLLRYFSISFQACKSHGFFYIEYNNNLQCNPQVFWRTLRKRWNSFKLVQGWKGYWSLNSSKVLGGRLFVPELYFPYEIWFFYISRNKWFLAKETFTKFGSFRYKNILKMATTNIPFPIKVWVNRFYCDSL